MMSSRENEEGGRGEGKDSEDGWEEMEVEAREVTGVEREYWW